MATKPPNPNALALALAAAQDDPAEMARRKSLEYLQSVWKEELQGCPICGTNDWGVNDVGTLPVRPQGIAASLMETTKVFPLVSIVCKTCGYTFFINEKWVLAGGTPPELISGKPPGA